MHSRPGSNDQADVRSFEIDVTPTTDGVWIATSQAIPGLNIEGDTFEEAVGEARVWAPELLRANRIVADREIYRLIFRAPAERPLVD